MDNLEVGGNRSDFIGDAAPNSFDVALEPGQEKNSEQLIERTDAKAEGVKMGTENVETERELGEIAAAKAMEEVLGEIGGNTEEDNVEATEMKPLIADGTTEKKLGKIGISLVGDKVDVEGVSTEVKKIKSLPLYEQVNAMNEATDKAIYANFGWMIGNDDIGEIQAEENAEKRKAA